MGANSITWVLHKRLSPNPSFKKLYVSVANFLFFTRNFTLALLKHMSTYTIITIKLIVTFAMTVIEREDALILFDLEIHTVFL